MMENKYQGINGIRMALDTMIDMAETIEKIKPENIQKLEFSSKDNIEFSEDGFSAAYENSAGTKYEITIRRSQQ